MDAEIMGNEIAETVEAATTEERADVQGEQQQVQKKYTDEDVNRIIAKKIAAERKRLSKLFQEEQQVSEIEQREKQVLLRELKADAKDALIERGLPTTLAGLLDYTDKEALDCSLGEVEAIFKAAVERGVKDLLRGTTPRANCGSIGSSEEALRNAFKP